MGVSNAFAAMSIDPLRLTAAIDYASTATYSTCSLVPMGKMAGEVLNAKIKAATKEYPYINCSRFSLMGQIVTHRLSYS